MNCLFNGIQWNRRSPELVLEAILLQRILVFEQFVSASKLAPEVLKERNCVGGFCLWPDFPRQLFGLPSLSRARRGQMRLGLSQA